MSIPGLHMSSRLIVDAIVAAVSVNRLYCRSAGSDSTTARNAPTTSAACNSCRACLLPSSPPAHCLASTSSLSSSRTSAYKNSSTRTFGYLAALQSTAPRSPCCVTHRGHSESKTLSGLHRRGGSLTSRAMILTLCSWRPRIWLPWDWRSGWLPVSCWDIIRVSH